MKAKKIWLLLVIGFISFNIKAQVGLGSIMGYLYSSDSAQTVPFSNVWIDINGEAFGVKTDLNGRYTIHGIPSGIYNINAESSFNGSIKMSGIVVNSDGITRQDLYLSTVVLAEIPVGGKKIIDVDNVTKMNQEEIKGNIWIRDPKQMMVGKSSEVSLDQNDNMIIRGSRPGDVVYFVDGVKQNDLSSIPGVAIRGMSVYTGGVPAKYGDTTGGVIIIETKGYFDLYYAWLASQNK